MAFTPQEFRKTLGQFATGITVVTTRDLNGVFHGITVNSFTSVSLDPPLVLICIDKKTDTHTILPQSGVFCVNILDVQQEDLSNRFAGRLGDLQHVFEDIPHHFEATGSPVFDEGLGFVDCRVVNVVDAGDHTIFIGQVEALAHRSEGQPLLYYRSRYTRLEEA